MKEEHDDATKVKSGKCDVRLSTKDMVKLNELADSRGITKSEVMRDALRYFHRWMMEK